MQINWLRLSVLALLGAVLCSLIACDGIETQAGVAGTGNAGRVRGVVLLGDNGVVAETRLIRILPNGSESVVSSKSTDSTGGFVFDSVVTGKYRVEAWVDGVVTGSSKSFEIENSTKSIVVVLVKPLFVNIDLRSLGSVDSVYLNYPENFLRKRDSLWVMQNIQGVDGVLYTRVQNEIGGPTWLTWKYSNGTGQLELLTAGRSEFLRVQSVDTTAYFPTSRTRALWTFDSLTEDGRIRDLSGNDNDFLMPSGKFLVPALHGNGLDLGMVPGFPPPRVVGDSIPASLRWWEQKEQAIRLRIWLKERPKGVVQLLGTFSSFQIGVNEDLQLQVTSRTNVDAGAWDWSVYASSVGSVPVGAWVDILILRRFDSRSFEFWINQSPIPSYSLTFPLPQFRVVPQDTFVLSSERWNQVAVGVVIDEMEISDSSCYGKHSIGMQTTQPIFNKMSEGDFVSYSFDDDQDPAGSFFIDSSSEVSIGNGRSLFLKLVNVSGVFGRDPVKAQLTFQMADLVGEYQKYLAYQARASFGDVIAKGGQPIAGIDYDTVSVSEAFVYRAGVEFMRFNLTACLSQWAKDSSSNYGLVIKPMNSLLPHRIFKLRQDEDVDWTTLITWVR